MDGNGKGWEPNDILRNALNIVAQHRVFAAISFFGRIKLAPSSTWHRLDTIWRYKTECKENFVCVCMEKSILEDYNLTNLLKEEF